MVIPRFRSSTPSEVCAVILASSVGARLFPLTSSPSSSSSLLLSEESSPQQETPTTKATSIPKHCLPLTGIPLLERLLHSLLIHGGVTNCVLALAEDDHVTLPMLMRPSPLLSQSSTNHSDKDDDECRLEHSKTISSSQPDVPSHHPHHHRDHSQHKQPLETLTWQSPYSPSSSTLNSMRIHVVRLDPDTCAGSAEALRYVEASEVIPPSSALLVVPADLVLYYDDEVNGKSSLDVYPDSNNSNNNNNNLWCRLLQAHRSYRGMAACTVLLADVAEVDERGIPLKESAKAKKGGLARAEEEIEYMALLYPHEYQQPRSLQQQSSLTSSASMSSPIPRPPRLIWKQSKIDVEHDETFAGSTVKLILPKPRLREGRTCVRTSWQDVHVYLLAPWVRKLVQARSNSIMSLQDDLIPLLLSRQWQGVTRTFGSQVDKDIVQDVLLEYFPQALLHDDMNGSNNNKKNASDYAPSVEYAVVAHVETHVGRVHSVPAYLYASKRIVSAYVEAQSNSNTGSMEDQQRHKYYQQQLASHVPLPTDLTVHAPKLDSLIASDLSMSTLISDRKLNCKYAVIGRNCQIGLKCRFNNVILMDDVVVGDQTILQNCIVSRYCVIEDHCNLNECQLAPGKRIVAGTKEKGESFVFDS
jgi:hypothetical protein